MLEFSKQLDVLPEQELKKQLDSLKSADSRIEKELSSDYLKFKTLTFSVENVHDFAWVCDFRYVVKKVEYLKTAIYVYVLPENYLAWRSTDQYAQNALAYMTKWYGSYIYPELSVVDSQNPHGGMEYPNVVLCAAKDVLGFRIHEQVVFHEIAHQWFYGMLANNEMADAWLDEGLVEFSEMRYFKEKHHGNFNDAWIVKAMHGDEWRNHAEYMKSSLFLISSYNNNLPTASDTAYHYRSRLEFNNVYLRPAFALNMLQYILGDSVFETAMRRYYTKHLLSHPSGKSLVNAFNDVTHQDWQWYFDQWVYSNKQCNYKAGKLYSDHTSTNNFLTTFEVIRTDSIIMPVTVEFQTENNSIIHKQIFADKIVNVVEFQSIDRVVSASIDPDRSLCELNPRDNSTKCNGVRLGWIYPTESFYQKTLFVTPWFGHTSFSGWGYGAASLLYDRLPNIGGNESQMFTASALYYPRLGNVDYSLYFRSTTSLVENFNDYFLEYVKWQGKTKARLGIEYRAGKYKFEHPSHNVLVLLSFDEVFDDRYFEYFQTQLGKTVSVNLRYTLGLDHKLSTHQFDVNIEKGFRIFGSAFNYSKFTLEGYNDVPISRRFSITNYISVGILDGTYPRQVAMFPSPSYRVMYSDFGSSVGVRYLYEKTFSGGLAGFVNENLTGKYLLSVRTDININIPIFKYIVEPFFLKLFGEIAKLWQSDNQFQSDQLTFLDAGIGMKVWGLDFAIPLWKNYSVKKNGTGITIQRDEHLAFNSYLLRMDLTYLIKLALELK